MFILYMTACYKREYMCTCNLVKVLDKNARRIKMLDIVVISSFKCKSNCQPRIYLILSGACKVFQLHKVKWNCIIPPMNTNADTLFTHLFLCPRFSSYYPSRDIFLSILNYSLCLNKVWVSTTVTKSKRTTLPANIFLMCLYVGASKG